MNIAFYFRDLPNPSELFYSSIISGNAVINTIEVFPEWVESKIDAFIVVGVSDEAVRQLYADANEIIKKAKEGIESKCSSCPEQQLFDCKFKRFYRFDNIGTATRYINWLTTSVDWKNYEDFGDYEDAMRDSVDEWFFYEEPKVFARELTMKDCEPCGMFFAEFHGPVCVIQDDEPTNIV